MKTKKRQRFLRYYNFPLCPLFSPISPRKLQSTGEAIFRLLFNGPLFGAFRPVRRNISGGSSEGAFPGDPFLGHAVFYEAGPVG